MLAFRCCYFRNLPNQICPDEKRCSGIKSIYYLFPADRETIERRKIHYFSEMIVRLSNARRKSMTTRASRVRCSLVRFSQQLVKVNFSIGEARPRRSISSPSLQLQRRHANKQVWFSLNTHTHCHECLSNKKNRAKTAEAVGLIELVRQTFLSFFFSCFELREGNCSMLDKFWPLADRI